MKIKQNCLKIGLVGLGLVLVLAFGYAQGSTTNTFINNTGQAVSGLHIQYNIGSFFLYQNPANTFGNVQEDGRGGVDLSSGTVAAGGTVQIYTHNRYELAIRGIRTWWWTDGSGILVGKTQYNGCGQPDCTSP